MLVLRDAHEKSVESMVLSIEWRYSLNSLIITCGVRGIYNEKMKSGKALRIQSFIK